jgi:hypothetical protein
VSSPDKAHYPRDFQLAAIRHHCRLAVETTHPRFRYVGPDKAYSVIVTVNSGYE